jgi:hypothetical protein
MKRCSPNKAQLAGIFPPSASRSSPVATLYKIATAYTVLALTRLEGRFRRHSEIPAVFSGGGLANALWGLDWPASATSLPQIALLASLLLLLAAMNGGGGIGAFAGARRALGF